ncbi:MAG: hypothetical protein KBH45_11210, partial [Verrucomicrobia bacterium]|nr:hypothetical protein [Verrucomicrobiota bacterium]
EPAGVDPSRRSWRILRDKSKPQGKWPAKRLALSTNAKSGKKEWDIASGSLTPVPIRPRPVAITA